MDVGRKTAKHSTEKSLRHCHTRTTTKVSQIPHHWKTPALCAYNRSGLVALHPRTQCCCRDRALSVLAQYSYMILVCSWGVSAPAVSLKSVQWSNLKRTASRAHGSVNMSETTERRMKFVLSHPQKPRDFALVLEFQTWLWPSPGSGGGPTTSQPLRQHPAILYSLHLFCKVLGVHGAGREIQRTGRASVNKIDLK